LVGRPFEGVIKKNQKNVWVKNCDLGDNRALFGTLFGNEKCPRKNKTQGKKKARQKNSRKQTHKG